MPRPSAFHVLLISRAPEMHREAIRSFRRQGNRVAAARRASHALALLRHRPELVLVDLALGASLTPSLVRALNRKNGSSIVVALHDGHLEAVDGPTSHLAVHGFCHVGDLGPGVSPIGGSVPPSLTLH